MMKTWKTKNGCKIIQVLSGRSNAYLIINTYDIILVDTGKRSSRATLSKNLGLLNMSLADIKVLILTHTHFDHCQSAKEIKEISGCKVIASGMATDSIKNGYTSIPNGSFLITKFIARLGKIIGKRGFGFEPFKQDIFVNGEYELDTTISGIKIIETPGHSADSVSIIIDNEIAIVGDVMFGVFKNSIFPPYSDDVVEMIQSWEKLLNTDCVFFLPGHGKEIHRNLIQKEYVKHTRKQNIQYSP